MSVLDHYPDNPNFLNLNNFRFVIKKAPTVIFNIQKVSIPEIELGVIMAGNPLKGWPVPGDHIDFSSLQLEFKVDSNMANYLEIFTWIVQLGYPNDWKEYAEIAAKPLYTGEGIRSDISLIIESAQNNPKWEMVFKDAFPYRLTMNPPHSTTEKDIQYMTASASFAYYTFKIRDINAEIGPND